MPERDHAWLIATDEAGYGPKLGPLVVVATAWRLPTVGLSPPDRLENLFAPLRQAARCGEVVFRVEDSKAAFQPAGGAGHRKLHAAVSCGLRWCGVDASTVNQLLSLIAAEDMEDIVREPWFDQLGDDPFLAPVQTDATVAHWGAHGIAHADALARVITPRRFNHRCGDGRSKADLLSEASLGLVRQLIDRNLADADVDVFCDRHGGRRYYGSVVQHHFPDTPVVVETESPAMSVYRFAAGNSQGRIRFTVKGDRFAPVAMSSLYAKYLRECCMASLNRFFAARHVGTETLRPTSGYPVDAARFMEQVRAICREHHITDGDWVRCR